MDGLSVALADLRLSLEVAAEAYKGFAERPQAGDAQSLFRQLGAERTQDAGSIAEAAEAITVELGHPTLDRGTAAESLGLGGVDVSSLASMAFRVQRSENSLARTTRHLHSLVEQWSLRSVLDEIEHRIVKHREGLRALRRSVRLGGTESFRASNPGQHEVDGHELTVWFGTNRALDGKGNFIGERSTDVRYGRCRVFIPLKRQMGNLGSSWLKRLFHGDDRIKLAKTVQLRAETFWTEINEASDAIGKPDRQALVFLHGYCVKFEEAARRTAQLKADLAFEGPTAFFGWPSLGSIFAYPADEAAIEASEAPIRQFLVDFANRSGASAVHVIAHSMGNRGLLRAMDTIASSAALVSKVRFGQIILAAPDVDRDVFTSLASAYVALSARSTLYVSENDRAIGLSVKLHRYGRVGIAPPVTIVPGIDTINVSKINLGLLGHSYVAEIRTVLSDIYYLLGSNSPPGKRHGLLEKGGPSNRHWTFAT